MPLRRNWIPVLLLLFFIVAGCGNNEDALDDGTINAQASIPPIVSETETEDYVVRFISEKAVYYEDEPVDLTAKLKYRGEEDEVTIFHGASPFWFEIRETTRGIDIPYVMTMQLLNTKLEQGEWYEEKYIKAGSFTEEDEHATFLKEFLSGETFPPGEYEIELRTDFYTGTSDVKEKEHHYTTSLIIQVLEKK